MEASNLKTMREALESVRNWCINRLGNAPYQVTVEGLLSVVNTALSKSPRNCDVGTADEQRDRLEAFCAIHFRCSVCPIYNGDSRSCVYRFLQMPYDEGGAK